jgi:hypothetical protein
LKKLFKLKEWLSVPDAARHLSILFGEDVSEADVLRLALDEHLTLSVDFVNFAIAQCWKIVPLADAERKIIQPSDGEPYSSIDGVNLGDGRVFSSDGIRYLRGVWDLAMIGAERLEIEHRYRLLTDGPVVNLSDLDGLLVSRPDGTWGHLVQHVTDSEVLKKQYKSPYDHPDNYYPAQALPLDAVLVVRTSALQDLEALVSEPEPDIERAVGRRERSTLLVIIAALAKLAKVDVTKPSSAATAIESETVLMGTRVAARTIEEHLKRIPEALENKSED